MTTKFSWKWSNFHKMFGNVRFKKGMRTVEVTRLWLEWSGRRQYLGRGVVFEPGAAHLRSLTTRSICGADTDF